MQNKDSTPEFGKKPDEISILNLLLKAKEYLIYLLNRSYFIFLFAALGSGYFGSKYFNVKKTYPGKVTFLFLPKDISKENKVTVMVYSRLANSSSIIEEILLEKSPKAEGGEMLINQYIDTYQKFKPKGIDAKITPDFRFSHSDKSTFTQEENYAFKTLLQKISTPRSDFSDGFISFSIEEGLGLINVNTSTPTQELTGLILNQIETKFRSTFFNNIVQAEQQAFNELKGVSDSLANGYKNAYYQLNQKRNVYGNMLKDSTADPNTTTMRQFHNDIIRLEARADVLKLEYTETLKQYKTAHLELKSKTPLIKVIEKTLMPIQPYRPSWKKAMIKGMLIGAGFVIFVLLLKKIIQDILEEQGNDAFDKDSYFVAIYQAVKRILPYLSIFTILICSFIFYLYWHENLREEPDAAPPQIEQKERINSPREPAPAKKEIAPVIEELPEEIDPEKAIEKIEESITPISVSQTDDKGIIIVGVFSNKDNILRSIRNIEKLGYEAYTSQVGKSTTVGVQFDYKSKKEVMKILERVRRKLNINAWVLQPAI